MVFYVNMLFAGGSWSRVERVLLREKEALLAGGTVGIWPQQKGSR